MIETLYFGSEFLSLGIATELFETLIYKLRCFGVRLDGPAIIHCDIKLVFPNASVPASMLNKRHNTICYHQVRESQVAGKIYFGWVPGERNLADLLTKTTMAGNIRPSVVEIIFHDKAVNWKDDKTCSSPRCPVHSHSLVCRVNSLLIVGIGKILNKELELIF